MREARREGYRGLFQKLDPGARNALRKIYTLARYADSHGGDAHGRHVILAMLASARHPDIARISLSNMIIRLGLKQALQSGNKVRAAHFEAVIADFHAALDTFMGVRNPEIMPDQELMRNSERLPNQPADTKSRIANAIAGVSGHTRSLLHERVLGNPVLLDQVLRFKAASGPVIARTKQHGADGALIRE